MTEDIEIRLRGDGIRPGLVRSHELAEILEAVEDFVTYEAARASPDVRREDLIVGLYAIADESIGLRFKASLAAITLPAFVGASQLIATSSFHDLAPQSRKALQTIAGFTKRHDATAEFKVSGRELPIATITAETIIPEEVRITGLTEIAAKTIRVGGKVPRAMLELLDGTVIYCEVSSEIAMELGHHLYRLGKFSGQATWLAADLVLDEFQILAFHPFPARDAIEMFTELSAAIGEDLERLGPVNELVTQLRRDEDEA